MFFGEDCEAAPVLGLECDCAAHFTNDLGPAWFILFTHYMIAMANAISFSFQVPCFWSHRGSRSFQLSYPRPQGFQSVRWVSCTNVLPLCVGNRWVNTAESLKHFPSKLLDYQLPFRVSSAQMSAKINGALSAKLIRSGLALLLLIRDKKISYVKQKLNQVKPMSNSPYFQPLRLP